MGAGNSKPDYGHPHHVFSESTPTTFSPNLVNSLDSSNQSDSTRASNLELKIQSRITSELEKLAQQESSKLASSTEAASAEESGDEKQFNPFDRLTGAAAEQDKKAQLSHDSVSKEIEELRKKLTGRKRLEQIDPTVEKAREDLVQCLRINDRRPLDCWEQREAFKREVGRLEKEFVQRTIK